MSQWVNTKVRILGVLDGTIGDVNFFHVCSTVREPPL